MEIEDLDQNHSHQITNQVSKSQMLSLKTLLIQALNNKDLNLVKFIIHNEKQEIIYSTLQNFTEEQHYNKFIKILFNLLESFPQECKYALKWLKVFLELNKDKLNLEQVKILKEKREFLLKKKAMIKTLKKIQTKSKILQKVLIENQQKEQKASFGEPLVYMDETKNQAKNSFISQYDQQQEQKQEMFFNIPKEENFEEEEEDLMYENAQKSQDKDDKYAMYFDEDENTENDEDDEIDEQEN